MPISFVSTNPRIPTEGDVDPATLDLSQARALKASLPSAAEVDKLRSRTMETIGNGYVITVATVVLTPWLAPPIAAVAGVLGLFGITKSLVAIAGARSAADQAHDALKSWHANARSLVKAYASAEGLQKAVIGAIAQERWAAAASFTSGAEVLAPVVEDFQKFDRDQSVDGDRKFEARSAGSVLRYALELIDRGEKLHEGNARELSTMLDATPAQYRTTVRDAIADLLYYGDSPRVAMTAETDKRLYEKFRAA